MWCYRRPRVDSKIDQIVRRLWHSAPRPEQIQRVEEEYTDLRFGFDEIAFPSFSMVERWNYDRFTNYLGTWKWVAEALPHSPEAASISILRDELRTAWRGLLRDIKWELYLRVGSFKNAEPGATTDNGS